MAATNIAFSEDPTLPEKLISASIEIAPGDTLHFGLKGYDTEHPDFTSDTPLVWIQIQDDENEWHDFLGGVINYGYRRNWTLDLPGTYRFLIAKEGVPIGVYQAG